MAARIIPFPCRPPRAETSYGFLDAEYRRWNRVYSRRVQLVTDLLAEAIPAQPTTEPEILTVLRRIEQRLAQLDSRTADNARERSL